MRFAAIALATGLAGTLFAANVQDSATIAGDGLGATVLADGGLDPMATGGVAVAGSGSRPEAIRLIDLRTGATCKTQVAAPATADFTDAPLGDDCRRSPSLARIAYWRSTADGTLIMADSGGDTILKFAPGDGVLYESVYPTDALITIVPARG